MAHASRSFARLSFVGLVSETIALGSLAGLLPCLAWSETPAATHVAEAAASSTFYPSQPPADDGPRTPSPATGCPASPLLRTTAGSLDTILPHLDTLGRCSIEVKHFCVTESACPDIGQIIAPPFPAAAPVL